MPGNSYYKRRTVCAIVSAVLVFFLYSTGNLVVILGLLILTPQTNNLAVVSVVEVNPQTLRTRILALFIRCSQTLKLLHPTTQLWPVVVVLLRQM